MCTLKQISNSQTLQPPPYLVCVCVCVPHLVMSGWQSPFCFTGVGCEHGITPGGGVSSTRLPPKSTVFSLRE